MRAERQQALEMVLRSPAARKLIVAGPGTGKTHMFREALEQAGQKGLALTFIRLLVRDLGSKLSSVAEVYSFHGFCKHLLHRLDLPGLTSDFDLYPPFSQILVEDLAHLGLVAVSERDLIQRIHNLDDQGAHLEHMVSVGDYYNASSFVDLVYRVLIHLRKHPEAVPAYPLIVVDEYQDFSRLETSFIGLLADRSRVLIAGDDDQALYSFKHASSTFLRDLAADERFERFPLPFCSRCTAVVVDAVNASIEAAQSAGRLRGRLAREYRCYLPDKLADSRRYPRLIHAHCSVQTRNAPYVARYVAQQIAAIPAEDLNESFREGYLTALVVGPVQFVRQVHAYLQDNGFPQALLQESKQLELDPLDGYARVGRPPDSRLGWRILLATIHGTAVPSIVSAAITGSKEISDLLPTDFHEKHSRIATLVNRVANADALSDSERAEVQNALGLAVEEIALRLAGADMAVPPEPDEAQKPSITCTSLVGAKGLSAGHVFVVGMNNGHFPRHPSAITDDEVCEFLVALSRTRKACHLISCGRFGIQSRLPLSTFLSWAQSFCEHRQIDAAYWATDSIP
jgi:superfamily I DNA/RNA helicase